MIKLTTFVHLHLLNTLLLDHISKVKVHITYYACCLTETGYKRSEVVRLSTLREQGYHHVNLHLVMDLGVGEVVVIF